MAQQRRRREREVEERRPDRDTARREIHQRIEEDRARKVRRREPRAPQVVRRVRVERPDRPVRRWLRPGVEPQGDSEASAAAEAEEEDGAPRRIVVHYAAHRLTTDLAYPYHSASTVKLSVLIPVYNEARTIDEILRLVTREPTEKEVVVVDDGSTDGTRENLRRLGRPGRRARDPPRAQPGQGAGGPHRAWSAARGEILVIQDADLEYDPAEYPLLLRPIEAGRADVVFGSRFVGSSEHRVQYFWHTAGNRLLTLISNVFTDLNLTDMATCYKAFHRRVVPSLDLESPGSAWTPRFTAKVARGGFRIFEVPVSYFGRSQAEGKKIRLKDGFSALWRRSLQHSLGAGAKR